MFFYPDAYMRQLLFRACQWAAAEDRLRLKSKARWSWPPHSASAKERRTIVHLLNDHSSYGRHSIYQKLAPLPEDLRKSGAFRTSRNCAAPGRFARS